LAGGYEIGSHFGSMYCFCLFAIPTPNCMLLLLRCKDMVLHPIFFAVGLVSVLGVLLSLWLFSTCHTYTRIISSYLMAGNSLLVSNVFFVFWVIYYIDSFILMFSISWLNQGEEIPN
jgi:hypothetical protein